MFCIRSVFTEVEAGNDGINEDGTADPGAFGAETEAVVGSPERTEGTATAGTCSKFDTTLLTTPPRLTTGPVLPVVVGTGTEFI